MPFAQGKLMNSPEEVTQETLQPAKVIIHPKKNIRTALSRIKYHINKAQEQSTFYEYQKVFIPTSEQPLSDLQPDYASTSEGSESLKFGFMQDTR